jgi:hypothetical protein
MATLGMMIVIGIANLLAGYFAWEPEPDRSKNQRIELTLPPPTVPTAER